MLFWISLALFWLFCAWLSAIIAHARGGEPGIGFILGLFIGPFGALASWGLVDEVEKERRLIEARSRKRCPACRELIRPAATVCSHCCSDLATLDLAAVKSAAAEQQPSANP